MTNPVDPVDLVELRIERRRAQLQRDWDDARAWVDEKRAWVARKNRWTPLVAVADVPALVELDQAVRAAYAAGPVVTA